MLDNTLGTRCFYGAGRIRGNGRTMILKNAESHIVVPDDTTYTVTITASA